MRYQPLVIVLAAVCVGIALDRMAGVPVTVWLAAAGTGWLLWLVLWWRGLDGWAAGILLVSAAAWGGAWHHVRWCLFADDDVGHYARHSALPVCVEAVAIKGPRRVPAPPYDPMRMIPAGDRTRLEIRVTGIRDRARWRAASGRTTLTVDGHLLGVRAGDRLRIFGQLSRSSPPHNPGGFVYAAYVRARRQLCRLRTSYPDCVTVIRRGRPITPRQWIESARFESDKLLWRHLDQRHSGLAAAVLLGAREQIDADQSEAFMETGTVHLLAISGLHVGIVAWMLFLVMRVAMVRRRQALVVVALATVAYTLLTDARPPAIRATILVLVLCTAHYLGRRPLAFNSLAAAGLVVLALNPAHLFHTGVHLSFLAVAGIMWFAPRWFGLASERDALSRLMIESRGWLARMLWLFWRSVRQLTLISAMIWLLTFPLVMARFHLLTPVAVPLNPLLWIPMTVALASGFGVLLFGGILPPVAAVFGWCCDRSLGLLESCIDVAREVPGSHFWVPGPADWWLWGFYGGLGLMAAFPVVRPRRRWFLALLAGWSAAGFAPSLLSTDEAHLDCTFLSVGHGLAIVLELPSGQTMLYDAGQFAAPRTGARSIAAFLWQRGVTHLDAVILSHSDADHYNILPNLLKRISVGVIYVSPVMFDEENQAMEALDEAIERSRIPVREISVGHGLGGGGCRIEVLHPPGSGVLGRDNANSLVLAIEYLGRRILLPGDIGPPGLDGVLSGERWDCDVLLAPHHGSRRSDPPGLAAWCSPEWVVISGADQYGQEETMGAYRAAGSRVLHTGRLGAVHVRIDATGVEVRSFLDSGWE